MVEFMTFLYASHILGSQVGPCYNGTMPQRWRLRLDFCSFFMGENGVREVENSMTLWVLFCMSGMAMAYMALPITHT